MATIQENITRIMGGKDSIRNSIINKGLEVPEVRVDAYADFILHIGEDFSMDVPDVSSTSVWDEINRIKSAEDSIKSAIREKGVDVPEGLRIDDLSVYVDEIEVGPQPLTFKSVGTTVIGIVAPNGISNLNLEFNLNKSGWQTYTPMNNDNDFEHKMELNDGDIIQFKGSSVYTGNGNSKPYRVHFICEGTGEIESSGCVESLINFEPMGNRQFASLFQDCLRLVTPPELNYLELTDECYTEMFRGCKNLTIAPEFPATRLANFCYSYMFEGCTNMSGEVILPATNINYTRCYLSMFESCSSLTSATIYATSLGNSTTTPCTKMFWYSGVNEIRCNATNMSKSVSEYWIGTSTGTFYKNPNWSGPSTRDYHTIPSGWTIEDWIQ